MKYRDLTWEQAARLCFKGDDVRVVDKRSDEVDDAGVFSLRDWRNMAQDADNRYSFYTMEEEE